MISLVIRTQDLELLTLGMCAVLFVVKKAKWITWTVSYLRFLYSSSSAFFPAKLKLLVLILLLHSDLSFPNSCRYFDGSHTLPSTALKFSVLVYPSLSLFDLHQPISLQTYFPLSTPHAHIIASSFSRVKLGKPINLLELSEKITGPPSRLWVLDLWKRGRISCSLSGTLSSSSRSP